MKATQRSWLSGVGAPQKRSESAQDVPIAITAITSEMRDVIGVISIGDLTDFTPGLSYATTLDRMSLCGVDGGRPPSSPKNKIALNAHYTWQMSLHVHRLRAQRVRRRRNKQWQ